MIGMHPSIRIELARSYRREQLQAAELRRVEAQAAAMRPAQPSRRLGRPIPRLRPEQSRP
jgi:hypothetical protein